MEAFSKQEQSRQEEFKAMQKDRELEIERLKKNALSESFQHQKEMKRHEHDLAMKKAQYEDQLRSERKDREIQKDLAKAAREEELRRGKFSYFSGRFFFSENHRKFREKWSIYSEFQRRLCSNSRNL